MTAAMNIATLKRGGRESVVVQRIADRILSMSLDPTGRAAGAAFVSLPSERELSKRLAVTRHAVRNALDHLQENGDVQRVAGGAALVVPVGISPQAANGASAVATRCINFIQGPALNDPTLQVLLYKYLAGYTEVLDRYEFKTRFTFWEDEREDFSQLLWNRVPLNQQACVLVNRSQPALLRWLDDHHIPFVVQYYRAYATDDLPPHHAVYVNKTGGAFMAATHLLELGHRRIGFVGLVPATDGGKSPPSPQYEGYHAAVRCAGLNPASEDLLPLNVELPELAFDACKAYLDRTDRPRAVMAANTGLMRGMLRAAKALGLRVPKDLSIVGFGSSTDPEIDQFTYVRLPQKLLAQTSVGLLMDVLEKQSQAFETRILECELHLGETTTAPNV